MINDFVFQTIFLQIPPNKNFAERQWCGKSRKCIRTNMPFTLCAHFVHNLNDALHQANKWSTWQMIRGAQTDCRVSWRWTPSSLWTSTTLTPCDLCLFGGLRSYGGGSGEKGDSGELWKGHKAPLQDCKQGDWEYYFLFIQNGCFSVVILRVTTGVATEGSIRP
jgi:hypothetical protein